MKTSLAAQAPQAKAAKPDPVMKRLLRAFMREFVELFLPQLLQQWPKATFHFIDKELPASSAWPKGRVGDLLVEVRDGRKRLRLSIYIENQAKRQSNMGKRLLVPTVRLWEHTDCPVCPVLLTTYHQPLTSEPDTLSMQALGLEVLRFRWHVIQLNQLNWLDYRDSLYPVALALMTRMKMQPRDRVRVKLQVYRVMTRLKLNMHKLDIIDEALSVFLPLSPNEDEELMRAVDQLPDREKIHAMKTLNPWEKRALNKGIEQGREQGREQGCEQGVGLGMVTLLLKQLQRRFGEIPKLITGKIQNLTPTQATELGEQLWDFTSVEDARRWLDKTPKPSPVAKSRSRLKKTTTKALV